jgi:hypothetical protein
MSISDSTMPGALKIWKCSADRFGRSSWESNTISNGLIDPSSNLDKVIRKGAQAPFFYRFAANPDETTEEQSGGG